MFNLTNYRIRHKNRTMHHVNKIYCLSLCLLESNKFCFSEKSFFYDYSIKKTFFLFQCFFDYCEHILSVNIINVPICLQNRNFFIAQFASIRCANKIIKWSTQRFFFCSHRFHSPLLYAAAYVFDYNFYYSSDARIFSFVCIQVIFLLSFLIFQLNSKRVYAMVR